MRDDVGNSLLSNMLQMNKPREMSWSTDETDAGSTGSASKSINLVPPPPPPPPLSENRSGRDTKSGQAKPAGGKWSQEEDDRLREIVKGHGPKNWKAISSLAFNGARSDVQCLHRWQKVLRPGLVKGPWLQSEDEIIVHLIKTHGLGNIKWSEIAANLPGRLGKQCRERWVNHLDPDLKKTPWTEEEDSVLMERQQVLGNKWREIAVFLPGRSENSVKNRWNSARRKRRRTEAALVDEKGTSNEDRDHSNEGSGEDGDESPNTKREKKLANKAKNLAGRRPGRPKGSTNKVKKAQSSNQPSRQQRRSTQDQHANFGTLGNNASLFGFNLPGQLALGNPLHQNSQSNTRLSPSFLPLGLSQNRTNSSPTLNDLDLFFTGNIPGSSGIKYLSGDQHPMMSSSFPGFMSAGKDLSTGLDPTRGLGGMSPVFFNISNSMDGSGNGQQGNINSATVNSNFGFGQGTSIDSFMGRQARTRPGNACRDSNQQGNSQFTKSSEDLLDMYTNGSEAFFRSLVSPPTNFQNNQAALENTGGGNNTTSTNLGTSNNVSSTGRTWDTKPQNSNIANKAQDSSPRKQVPLQDNNQNDIKEDDDREGLDLGTEFTVIGTSISNKQKELLREDSDASYDKHFHKTSKAEVLGINTKTSPESDEKFELVTFDSLIDTLVE